MKKYLLGAVFALFCILPTISFARQGSDDGTGNDNRGCSDLRKSTQDQVAADRAMIERNRNSFHVEQQGLTQFFSEANETERTAIKQILETTKENNDLVQEKARAAYKISRDTTVLTYAHQKISDNRKAAFDDLTPYVNEGEEDDFATWTTKFLEVLNTNKELRRDNAQTRTDFKKSCYDRKTASITKRGELKLDKLLSKLDTDNQQVILEKLIEMIEKLITKVNNINKPAEWKTEKNNILQSFLATVYGYLDITDDNADDNEIDDLIDDDSSNIDNSNDDDSDDNDANDDNSNDDDGDDNGSGDNGSDDDGDDSGSDDHGGDDSRI